MDNDTLKESTDISLIEEYNRIMSGVPFELIEQYGQWEKSGDNFKQYSRYDTNKYETSTSSNIVMK